MMGRLKLGQDDVSPRRLAKDIDAGNGTDLETVIVTKENELESAHIEALYQVGRAMTAVSTVLENNLL